MLGNGERVEADNGYRGEPDPVDLPEVLGNPVEMSTYFNAGFANNLHNRRSVTGIIIFLNQTPVKWYSKRQNTIETSMFGAELVAACIATELTMEIRYKLRMLGVPILNNTTLYGDNKSVIMNTTLPSSSLKKRHNAIAYHFVREAVAAGIIRLVHIPGKENIADVLTKPLAPNKLYELLKLVMFRNTPDLGG